MKNFKITSVLILLFSLFFSCTNSETENINSDNTSELIAKFSEVESRIQTANLNEFDMNTLRNELDAENNYEETIYNPILSSERIITSVNNDLEYEFNEFDEYFAQHLMQSFTNDNLITFFNRTDKYKSFLSENITDINKLKTLNTAIEKYKWIKYSLIEKIIIAQNDSNIAYRCGTCYPETACFDGCMEDGINDQLDSFTGWAAFLWNPGAVTGWIFAECIENCYF